MNVLKIAHRGAKAYEPENTLQAFQKALNLNSDGIELDVQLSSDGHIIVIHDETIDRTTNGKGLVGDFTLAELESFLIDGKYQIPTLIEVFDLVDKKCLINIELKGLGTAPKVVSLIEEYISKKDWNYNHFIISSFEWNMLEETSNLNPNIPIGVLTEENVETALAFAEKIKAKAIHPDFNLLNNENVQQMQEKGFLVLPWTVNTEEDIQKVKSYQVNGIISDNPDKI
ncbi:MULTISPECIES: glycerophosphodiester phosphodiesterase family protein [Flavobacterium]|uniref:Glycerophosphodiester phosphodiesterase n=1 Tax=Flavobacterium ginsengisoli TaxID=871694 RepID=A0ABP7EWQ7_9FLAO|nr:MULTISPECIES: glycerophosphodiester phosphodiesterase family protein [Flavobacterium]MBJ2123160.1 glycerophosphodiester phosphodiesterase [Flavobacterium sp. IB48]